MADDGDEEILRAASRSVNVSVGGKKFSHLIGFEFDPRPQFVQPHLINAFSDDSVSARIKIKFELKLLCSSQLIYRTLMGNFFSFDDRN